MTTTFLIIAVTTCIFVGAYFVARLMKAEGHNQETYSNQICGRGDF